MFTFYSLYEEDHGLANSEDDLEKVGEVVRCQGDFMAGQDDKTLDSRLRGNDSKERKETNLFTDVKLYKVDELSQEDIDKYFK